MRETAETTELVYEKLGEPLRERASWSKGLRSRQVNRNGGWSRDPETQNRGGDGSSNQHME